jgi:hypothetical protein
MLSVFLLVDDTDSAKQSLNTNNSANLDISAKSLYDVSLGTQKKGLMKKNEIKNSHTTIPLSSVSPPTLPVLSFHERILWRAVYTERSKEDRRLGVYRILKV